MYLVRIFELLDGAAYISSRGDAMAHKDHPKYDVLVFGGIHIAAELVRRSPKGSLDIVIDHSFGI
jgi:hypothetical protein